MSAAMRDASDGTVLTLSAVRRAVGGVNILRHVDLRVNEERHVLIGPNGAGKTTLFNVITGQVAPSGGRVMLKGVDITRLAPNQRARLGIGRTFQVVSLFRHLTVRENVLVAAWAPMPMAARLRNAFDGAEREELACALLAEASLYEKRDWPVANLSYGEQRQLEIALALATRPKILLMDEPMAGLSPEERRRLGKRIVELGAAMPILLIDHNLDEALEVAERITVLHLGEVVCSGSPDEIRGDATVRRIYLGGA